VLINTAVTKSCTELQNCCAAKFTKPRGHTENVLFQCWCYFWHSYYQYTAKDPRL